MVIPLQPLLDERPEDDLKADRELERDRRLPGQDPGPVQDVSGENKEDSGLTVEHHHLRILLRPSGRRAWAEVYNSHLLYKL